MADQLLWGIGGVLVTLLAEVILLKSGALNKFRKLGSVALNNGPFAVCQAHGNQVNVSGGGTYTNCSITQVYYKFYPVGAVPDSLPPVGTLFQPVTTAPGGTYTFNFTVGAPAVTSYVVIWPQYSETDIGAGVGSSATGFGPCPM
jgi:hypothetical protein